MPFKKKYIFILHNIAVDCVSALYVAATPGAYWLHLTGHIGQSPRWILLVLVAALDGRHHGRLSFQTTLPLNVPGHPAGGDGAAVQGGVSQAGVLLHPHLPQGRGQKSHGRRHHRDGHLRQPVTPGQGSEPRSRHTLLPQDVASHK